LDNVLLPWLSCACLAIGWGSLRGAEPEPSAADSQFPPSPAAAEDREGMERGEWAVDSTGSQASARVVRHPAQPANRLLCVEYTGSAAGKVVLRRPAGLSASENGTLRGWVYCRSPSLPSVALALCTTSAYLWQESEAIQLQRGWTELRFDLGAEKWKSAATGWKNTGALRDRQDVRTVELLIYNGQSAGLLYLDGLKISTDAKLAALVQKLGAEEFDEREEATRALLEIGWPAVESLREAMESDDAETALRARRLVEEITGARRPEADAEAQSEPSQQLEGVRIFIRR
jgi:hypothetical protein